MKKVQFLSIIALTTVLYTNESYAYYDTQDITEYVEIQPNWTAFLIPETGANKDSQAAFMSEKYLSDNKVAMKRVQIPHVLLKNYMLSRDHYIPASRLLEVDRTPVTREWVSSTNRGTSTKDEGFHFESAESINVSTGIVISAFVKEEDAPKFVYWFGAKTNNNVDVNDPSVTFNSVIYAKSLAEVVDDNVKHKVQSVLAREAGKYPLVELSLHKADIISIVEKEVKETFSVMGITISYVGYAESLTYDPRIQESIDRVFIANKRAEEVKQLASTVSYEQAMVNINYINAQAEALKKSAEKWNGSIQLPNWIVLPESLSKAVAGLFEQPSVKQSTTK